MYIVHTRLGLSQEIILINFLWKKIEEKKVPATAKFIFLLTQNRMCFKATCNHSIFGYILYLILQCAIK